MSGIELAMRLKADAWSTEVELVALTGMGQKPDLDATRRQLAAWFTPTQPISTPSPTGQVNPGPPDPSGDDNPNVAPEKPP